MGTDPLLGSPEVAPSLVGAALRLGGLLLLAVGAAAAWVYWQRRARGVDRRVEVLDRAFLSRGASVALLRVEDRRLLIGISSEGVRLLRDLEPAPPGAFPDVLARASAAEGEGR